MHQDDYGEAEESGSPSEVIKSFLGSSKFLEVPRKSPRKSSEVKEVPRSSQKLQKLCASRAGRLRVFLEEFFKISPRLSQDFSTCLDLS